MMDEVKTVIAMTTADPSEPTQVQLVIQSAHDESLRLLIFDFSEQKVKIDVQFPTTAYTPIIGG